MFTQAHQKGEGGLKSIKLMKKEKLQWIPQKLQKIIRDYYKQLYASKMDNLEEKFFGEYNLSRLNQEEIENMNRIITSAEIETVI